MSQIYDKIFKENIEELILPLAGKLLGIHPEKLEEIPDDLQVTIERKPDFLKKVCHQESFKDYILHIEFQTEDDIEMVYRMHEYYAILLRKYKIQICQFLFFIGKSQSKMLDKLNLDCFNLSIKLSIYAIVITVHFYKQIRLKKSFWLYWGILVKINLK